MSMEREKVHASDAVGYSRNRTNSGSGQGGESRDGPNPWKSEPVGSVSPVKGFVPNFMDILDDEQRQRKELKRLQAKPLDLIQKEELAIQELLAYYNAEDNPEESISVQRITPIVSSPIWNVTSKKELNNSSHKFY